MSRAAVIASGGLTGGLSSVIAGGNFWDGARQGVITAGLNHTLHEIAGGLFKDPGDPKPKKAKAGTAQQEVIQLEEVLVKRGQNFTRDADGNLINTINDVAGGVGIANDFKLGLIEIGSKGAQLGSGMTNYLKYSKNLGVAGNAISVFSSGYHLYNNPTLGNSIGLGVQGLAIGASFIPVVGWGVSIGIGTADMIWGDQFYHWIDK